MQVLILTLTLGVNVAIEFNVFLPNINARESALTLGVNTPLCREKCAHLLLANRRSISIVILESSLPRLRTLTCFITCMLSSRPFSVPRPSSHSPHRRTTRSCRDAVLDNRPGEQQSLLGRCRNTETLQYQECVLL